MNNPISEWNHESVNELFRLPFIDLLMRAQTIHREHFPANEIQLSTLLSVKTGACPEDCSYCSQSGHYKTPIAKEKLMPLEEVLKHAKQAKEKGATRFCMGGAWRTPPEKAMTPLTEMVKAVKSLGLETCLTAGMLDDEQTATLKAAGLDYYNHNLDTSANHYSKVTTTRTYQDRLDTPKRLQEHGIKTCCGGILGLGEQQHDVIDLLLTLASLNPAPDSIPLNLLVPIPGTPLADAPPVDPIDFVKTIAVCRIMMPKSMVRLSAGRNHMDKSLQALCFFAGANSIHFGEKLLTTPSPEAHADMALFEQLGLHPMAAPHCPVE